jgi:hypothetical protein
MRYTFIIILLLFALCNFAQAPHKINYQGIARNANGIELANQQIGLRVSILQGSTSGTIVYRETHTVTTNQLGLFSVQIGSGTVLNGTMNTIDWSAGPFYHQTEMDVEGGSNYSLMGASELISVPYALYAEKAGSTESSETTNCGGGGHYACKECPTMWSDASANNMYMADCARWCGNNTQDGYDDWRLPTLMEAIELTELTSPGWEAVWTTTPLGYNGIYPSGIPTTIMYSCYGFDTNYGVWVIIDSNGTKCRCVR